MISTKVIPVLLEIKELKVALFIILIKRARKYEKLFIIFKILLENMTKALILK